MRESIQAVITKLEAISRQVEGYAENATDQKQADELYEEVQCIEDALHALNSIE